MIPFHAFFDRPSRKVCMEIGRCVDLVNISGRLTYSIDLTRLRQDAKSRYHIDLNKVITTERGTAVFCKILFEVFGKGPKLFRMDQLDWEALESMNLSLELADYAQPFETIVLELPESYFSKKILNRPEGAVKNPRYVFLHWKQNDYIISFVVFEDGTVMSNALNWARMIIEDMLRSPIEGIDVDLARAILPAEGDFIKDVTRAAMNACLLMEEVGVKNEGPLNPSLYARFQRRRDRDAVREHPIVYSFAQKVKLFDREHLPGSNTTGVEVGPHWRRGHWRMQPYGTGNSLRKRIRIKPVLVNAHLFGGDLQDTFVEYEK